MAEGIGLLIVLPGNAICVEGMAMKQETVNPVCQSQEGKTSTESLCRETRLVMFSTVISTTSYGRRY